MYPKILVDDVEFGHDCLLYHPILFNLHDDHLSHSLLRGGPRLPARKWCPRQTIHSLPSPPHWGFVVKVLAEVFGNEGEFCSCFLVNVVKHIFIN